MFYNSQETKLLLNGIEPFIGLQWLLYLVKDRRFSVQKVLEFTVLIWFGSLVLVLSPSMTGVLRKPVQYFPIDHWASRSWAIISAGMGYGGGGRSTSPSQLVPAPP